LGVFAVPVEIGDPRGERFERVEALVDSGASYTAMPASALRALGVVPDETRLFVLADGRQVEREIGETRLRIDGRTKTTTVVFADEDARPLLGAVTLEEFGLGIDPTGRKLVAMPGYLLGQRLGHQEIAQLRQLDIEHQLHPQYHIRDHEGQLIYAHAIGSTLWDVEGNAYIDGLSALWNVAVGYGRKELVEAAARQMEELSFSNSYAGYANVPSIRLAERLMSLVYPNMQAVFFCNSGSEAVEGAFKVARYYWFLQGRPEKHKVISRREAYHGGTLGATAAVGLPPFHKGFGPMPSNFMQAETCYPYRCGHCRGAADCSLACAEDIEAVILREGPETVAAVIGEPVHGAGGVIPPTPGYWPKVREICDRHEVLLIADEVITGFGRTGKWFALEHWGVQPDIMSVAKAITSAYVPLAGFIVSKQIHDAILAAPADAKFMHGYTNAGHPVACAVALRNLQIIEEEGLVARAAEMGERLLQGLRSLGEHPNVGDIRGLGLIAGVELVADKSTRAPFAAAQAVGPRMLKEMRKRGVITRVKGDSILLAPPLVITAGEIDQIVSAVAGSIEATFGV
jgi:clan AA aspartic protease